MTLVDRVQFALRCLAVSANYRRVLWRLRKAARFRKLRVAFLVSELPKWKAQAVFDRMVASDVFEPFVAVHNLGRTAAFSKTERRRLIEEKLDYFVKRGMQVVSVQSENPRHAFSAKKIDADIVFYQQPWDLHRELSPWLVSRRALTFYIPYYLPSRDSGLAVGHKVHHFLFGYIVMNAEMVDYCLTLQNRNDGAYTTKYLPLGHPTLDAIPFCGDKAADDGYIIYAPHWTVDHINFPLAISTFLENGQEVLEYAKGHPDQKWAFKPHPALRSALVEFGGWAKEKVDDYYAEWEQVGKVCTGGQAEYIELFRHSRAMVTDCNSFLTEYGLTGLPIIWLISGDSHAPTYPMLERLYATYRRVSNVSEMLEAFDRLFVRREDDRMEDRVAAIEAFRHRTGDSAKMICEYLTDLLDLSEEKGICR